MRMLPFGDFGLIIFALVFLVIPCWTSGSWQASSDLDSEKSGTFEADDFHSGPLPSWEDDFDSGDKRKINSEESKQAEEIDDVSGIDQPVPGRRRLNEAELFARWKSAIFVDRICTHSSMIVPVRRSLFAPGDGKTSDSVIVIRSCCLGHRLHVNQTHIIFDLSFNEFEEQDRLLNDSNWDRNASCCTDLRLFRYEVGVAYVFQLSAYIFSTDSVQDVENLIAYCYFEDPKHSKGTSAQASIRFYSSVFDQVAYSGTTKHMAFNEDIVFEIVDEEGPLATDNMPINCWLSPQSLFDASFKDKAATIFVENGCPARNGAVLDRKTGSRMDSGTRVRFSLGTFYRREKTFLYVHCQYIKCSNATSGVGRVGELPPCPGSHSCAYNLPVTYSDNELSTATSYTVLLTGRNKPQEVHLPSGNADGTGPYDRYPCKDQSNKGATVDPESDEKISLVTAGVCCFGAFFMGVALIITIWFCERRYRVKKPPEGYEVRLRPKSDVTNLPLVDHWKCIPGLSPNIPRDTEAVTAPPPRQRHFSGHDGYEPSNAAVSLGPSSSAVVGGSTVQRNDELWNLKNMENGI